MTTAATQLMAWAGSDVNSAQEIVSHFAPHRAYVELFAGGCSVLFAKSPVRNERINDLNGDLVNLARAFASDRYPELADWLMRTVWCDRVHRDAVESIERRRAEGRDVVGTGGPGGPDRKSVV